MPAGGPLKQSLRTPQAVVRLIMGTTSASLLRGITADVSTFMHDLLLKPQCGFHECNHPFSELHHASENFVSVGSPLCDGSASRVGRLYKVETHTLWKAELPWFSPLSADSRSSFIIWSAAAFCMSNAIYQITEGYRCHTSHGCLYYNLN